ncbi:MAG TPA: hypothetical protein VF898_02590, partial [Chloroflexota bacterium]
MAGRLFNAGMDSFTPNTSAQVMFCNSQYRRVMNIPRERQLTHRTMVARLWLVLLITVGGVPFWDASGAGAQAACRGVAQCVVAGLTNSDVYLDPYMIANGKIRPADKAALQLVVKSAAKRGVPVKISVSRYPSKSYADAYAAARALRHFLDFSGVLILIAPNGIGVSSNTLNLGEIQAIEEHARPLCFAGKTVQCAAVAADA